jgi:CheY-like chemotaxis protein
MGRVKFEEDDGFHAELKRFIRRGWIATDAGGDVPAVALTALASDEDRRQSKAAGFQMHLPKPVDADCLSAAVVELAGRPSEFCWS